MSFWEWLGLEGRDEPEYKGIDFEEYPVPEYFDTKVSLSDFEKLLQSEIETDLSADLGLDPQDIRNMIAEQAKVGREQVIQQMRPQLKRMGKYGAPAGADVLSQALADVESKRITALPEWLIRAAEAKAGIRGAAQQRGLGWAGQVEGKRQAAFSPKMALWQAKIGEAGKKAATEYERELKKYEAPTFLDYLGQGAGLFLGGQGLSQIGGLFSGGDQSGALSPKLSLYESPYQYATTPSWAQFGPRR